MGMRVLIVAAPALVHFFPEALFSVSSQEVIDGEYPHPQPQKMC